MNPTGTYVAVVIAILGLVWTACKEKPAPTVPSDEITLAASPSAQAAPLKNKIAAANPTKDDPDAPKWLPKPEEIAGWVRTSNVNVIYPGEWDKLQDERLQHCVDAFLIKSASTCEYTSLSPDSAGALAKVTIVEAYHRDDAYGLLTSMMFAAPDKRVGSLSSHARRGAEHIRNCWQGSFYVQAVMTASSLAAADASIDKLVAGLVKPIPSKDQPILLNYLPTTHRLSGPSGDLWVAREHLHTLPEFVLRDALGGRAVMTTKSLGLGPDTLMVIAAYDPGEGEPPNYVWLVQYPTVEAAVAAYKNYKKTLRKIKPTPAVLMQPPAGRYLCGSWTPEQESIMHILPEITKKLPKPPSP